MIDEKVLAMLSDEEVERQLREIEHLNFIRETTNYTFFPLFSDEHRFLVLMGGAGSGKSEFAMRKIAERMRYERGHRFLVIRKVAKTLRESCYDGLCSIIKKYYCEYPDDNGNIPPGNNNHEDWSMVSSDLRITYKPNDNTIIFIGVDDPEKLKSIYGITGVWIEEATELTEADFNQLNLRLRTIAPSGGMQFIITFNPISVDHWLKKRFFDESGEDWITHHSTYKDNRFLPKEYIKQFEYFREHDPYYYSVYALGEWGIYGNSVFNQEEISRRKREVGAPIMEGEFLSGKFLQMGAGPIRIYEEPDENHPYVIGGDTSGEGSDFFTAHVIDNITGKQVAVLQQQYDEDLYAQQVYELGKMYNWALVAIEANFSSYPIDWLTKARYPSMYVRERFDTFTGELENRFGFRTTSKNRLSLISNLVVVARTHIDWISDYATLGEMETFVRNDAGRPEAMSGSHDDLVMGLAIAYQARSQAPSRVLHLVTSKKKKVKWERDQFEDYFKCKKDEEREKLIEMWGEPDFA